MSLEDMFMMMRYGGGYSAFLAVFGVILVIAAVVGAVILRLTVFSEKNQGKYTGFMGWLYQFMNFRSLIVQPVVKLLYCITACVITAVSLIAVFSGGAGILAGLINFVVGQIVARLIYEMMMLTILLVTNVMEINKKLGGKSGDNVEFSKAPADMSSITARVEAAKQAYQAARAAKPEAEKETPESVPEEAPKDPKEEE